MVTGNAGALKLWVVQGALAVGLLSGATACLQMTPRARHIVGPDGSPMVHVACEGDQGACFELAGQSCPGGYVLTPIFDPSSNNFLVRCRNAPVVADTLPPPAETRVVIRSLAAEPAPTAEPPEPWPPPSQPWLPVDPWAPGVGTATATALPQTVRLPDGGIDLGY